MVTGQEVINRYAAINEADPQILGPDAASQDLSEVVLLDKEQCAEVLTDALHSLGYWATWAPQRQIDGSVTGWWHVTANTERWLLEGLSATAQHLVDRAR